LEQRGITAGAGPDRAGASSRSASAGQLHPGDETWPLRVVNQFASLDEIRDFPVNDQGLKLAEVASVGFAEPELEYGRHLDRSRAIGLNVIKESGSNSVAVAKGARAVLAQIAADPMLEGIRVLTFTDQGEDIENSISGLLHAGLIGALLATIVLFFFLRNGVTTLVVGLAIPFS